MNHHHCFPVSVFVGNWRQKIELRIKSGQSDEEFRHFHHQAKYAISEDEKLNFQHVEQKQMQIESKALKGLKPGPYQIVSLTNEKTFRIDSLRYKRKLEVIVLEASFLPVCTLEGNLWWFKYLVPCHSCGNLDGVIDFCLVSDPVPVVVDM